MKLHTITHAITTFITFLIWTLVAPAFILMALPFTILPLKYRLSNRLYYLGSYLGAMLMVKATLIKFHIKGKNRLSTYLKQPSIVVCNHSSAIDIPLVQMLIGPHPHVWFSKASYTKIPLFGFLLRRMNIIVNRESTTECAKTIQQAHTFTDGQYNHILIFPEGMRHNDGNIHHFFTGFAVMAREFNRPVIPIVIHGLNTIFPKNSKFIHSSANKVTISIGQPMWYTDGQTRQEFVKQVHDWFVHELEELKNKT
jgi:1-acyl-sn-glycerol-3-phosphate acyltransferase